jgi:uncharacterized protein YndB with AHSA1/START domain
MTKTGTVEITTPSECEVVLTRVFNAPRTLVFDALTKPDLLKRWLQAPGRTLAICEVDLSVGGAYRFTWRGPGKKDVGTHGVYRQITRPERLVATEAWEDWDVGEMLVTTVLTEVAGRTTFTSTMLYPSREVRDAVLKSGLESGAAENYDRLAELLAAPPERRE